MHILLADDDRDDQVCFIKALKMLPILAQFAAVDNGEKLMEYLFRNFEKLPDILFLDLNMPRKNGFECISEIQLNPRLRQLPIIIYSTFLHKSVIDLLYQNGAYYYIRKCPASELKEILRTVLMWLLEKNFSRPSRDNFIFDATMVNRSSKKRAFA